MFKLYLLSTILHFICIAISLFGSIYLNISAIVSSDLNQQLYIINIFMLVLGIFNMVASLAFALYFRFRVLAVQRSSAVTPEPTSREGSAVGEQWQLEPPVTRNTRRQQRHTSQLDAAGLNDFYDTSVYFGGNRQHQQQSAAAENELPPDYDFVRMQHQVVQPRSNLNTV
jgi:hypothetical protein